jgi:Iron-containing redox enzyme
MPVPRPKAMAKPQSSVQCDEGATPDVTNSLASTMAKFIQEVIDRAQEQVRLALPAITDIPEEARRQILRRYAAAIAPNFVPWMAAAAVCSRSLEARFSAAENVYLEIKDDHPKLLRDFVSSCNCDPDRSDYIAVAPAVGAVKIEVSLMSGLFITSLMCLLENVSSDFVPWLEAIAYSLGGTDFRYTAVHGVADAEHAKQFKWALEKEAQQHEDSEREISRSIEIATSFIFSALNIERLDE